MKMPALLGLSICLFASAAEPAAKEVHNPLMDQYSADDLGSMAGVFKPPQGVTVVDVAQRVSAAMSAMNKYDTGAASHLGFSIFMLEPKAWVGVQKAKAAKHFASFDPSKLTVDSNQPILRVFVNPDLPASALGTWAANNAEHVVLRSIDKTLVAQPISIQPADETVQNIFGAKWTYAGLEATFSMADLNEIRGASPTREFLVTVIGEKKRTNRDFRIKPKFFAELGD